MVDFLFKECYSVDDLVEIVSLLRSENGCPWDKEQTHKSIRKDFIEEVCEVCEAIDEDDSDMLREELGDVLLQVVFHTGIETEAGNFTLDDVADGICKKLILRHPHVFGDIKVSNTSEVLENWNNIKQVEKKQSSYTDTLLSVPKTLPALMKAQKIGSRAKRANMDFPDAQAALECLECEINELKDAYTSGDKERICDEMGDVLFSAVNTARHMGVDSEECLEMSCAKFVRRFAKTEEMVRLDGKDMTSLSIDELDAYWKKAK